MLKGPLRLGAGGDVLGDGRASDDCAVLAVHRRHGERDVNEPPFFASAGGLEALHGLTEGDAAKYISELVFGRVGCEHSHVMAGDLIYAVTVEVFGAAVPADDGAIERLAEDRVAARIDDADSRRVA